MTNTIIIITGICLLINAIYDWFNRESLTVTFFVTYILLFMITRNPQLFVYLIITIFFSNDNAIMGGGDVDAILLSLFTLGIYGLIPQLIIACIGGMIYRFACADEKIPFITMLFIGYVVSVII